MQLKVGQRDKRHRTFMVWKVAYNDSCRWELGDDGIWYNSAGPWRDYEKAKAAVEAENNLAKSQHPDRRIHDGTARLIPVWRKESEVRSELRDLVETLWSDLLDLPHRSADAVTRAKKYLEETE